MSEQPLSLQRDVEGVLRCTLCGEGVEKPTDDWIAQMFGHECNA